MFKLSLVSATALIIGSMIGSGIFISPKGVLQQTESVGMVLVVWSLSGVVAMFGKTCLLSLLKPRLTKGVVTTPLRISPVALKRRK